MKWDPPVEEFTTPNPVTATENLSVDELRALMLETGDSAATLRKQVTSPGGTTEAALDVLSGNGGLAPLLRQAVAAAAQRSRELGRG